MRINIQIETAEDVLVPFDHQPALVGVIHKWLGDNDFHGVMALHSFSRIRGGKVNAEQTGLLFGRRAELTVSAHEPDFLKMIIYGIQKDPTLFMPREGFEPKGESPFKGFRVVDVLIEPDPEDLSSQELFLLDSPILIKKTLESGQIKHIRYDDEIANKLLTDLLRTKMELVGLSDSTLDISFDLSWQKKTTKLVNYKGIRNRSNFCPVLIQGSDESKVFARNVGLGHSTGIGFGALK